MTIDPRRDPAHADDPERRVTPLPARRDRLEADDPRVTGEMPFLGHLEELRGVLFRILIAALAGTLGGWWLAPRVLEDIVRRTVREAIILSPLEAFNERLKLSLILGVLITLPYVLWQVWGFVVPGLFRRERRLVPLLVGSSLALFLLGAWAAYDYVVPLVVRVLESFLTPSIRTQIQLGALLSFVYNMALACGLVFQLPLVTMLVTWLGLVTPRTLLRQWRYAIVATFLVTAIITPGDVVTAQLVMGVPMVGLYFLSVALSFLVARRRERGESEWKEEAGAPEP